MTAQRDRTPVEIREAFATPIKARREARTLGTFRLEDGDPISRAAVLGLLRLKRRKRATKSPGQTSWL